jgi:hypothetical protein
MVLYGCENLVSILRGEYRLRVFENRVLRTIFEPKRGEVMGGFRKLHNEELHDVYTSPSIIRTIKSGSERWVVHMARMQMRNSYMLLGVKPERKRPLGRIRRR